MPTYESHITVQINSPQEMNLFEDIAQSHKCKVIKIKEDSGASPQMSSQVMTGKFHTKTNYEYALLEMHSITNSLLKSDIEILREKLERIGEVDEFDPELDKIIYNEYHVKYDNLSHIKKWAESLNCHTSINQKHPEYIFVTTRSVETYLDLMFYPLNKVIHHIVENVMYDSNQSFDVGWTHPSCLDCKLKSVGQESS